jgi:hypothetical protein
VSATGTAVFSSGLGFDCCSWNLIKNQVFKFQVETMAVFSLRAPHCLLDSMRLLAKSSRDTLYGLAAFTMGAGTRGVGFSHQIATIPAGTRGSSHQILAGPHSCPSTIPIPRRQGPFPARPLPMCPGTGHPLVKPTRPWCGGSRSRMHPGRSNRGFSTMECGGRFRGH